ncbi:MAG: outer membrane lipid asymmetry maintenance protein MlaD [Cocleimonas sp.]
MGSSRKAEIFVGAFVLASLLAFFVLAMNISNLGSLGSDKGYQVKAQFDNIGGLQARAKVTLSGVSVGRVTGISYDKESFQAVVTMTINAGVDYLPSDTQASIYTSGLLGEQYISLEPGAEDDVLAEGSVVTLTQSAVVLEEIIGKLLVSFTTKD